MSAKKVIRGYDPEDKKWFTGEALTKLNIAQEEIRWLMDRGYKISPATDFVGNHYQLSARQRIALKRGTCSSSEYEERNSKMLPFDMAKNAGVNIDGFNLIITLEVALSGSLLILGNDGVIRDLAGLRGTYKPIDKTEIALDLILKTLYELEVPKVKIFLDAPVSNSGTLRGMILSSTASMDIPIDVELVPNADVVLSKLDNVITTDSVILDQCKSWINLSRKIIEANIKEPLIIDFSNKS